MTGNRLNMGGNGWQGLKMAKLLLDTAEHLCKWLEMNGNL